MAKEAYLYIEDKIEKYIDEYEEAGYKHEIEEANNCIINIRYKACTWNILKRD